jgi:hypothetical protein
MSNISFNLCQGIFKLSLSLMLPNKTHIFFCCTCSTRPSHLNLVDLIILTISHGEWYKPQNFSTPFFLQPRPITSFLLGPNISTQFSNTITVYRMWGYLSIAQQQCSYHAMMIYDQHWCQYDLLCTHKVRPMSVTPTGFLCQNWPKKIYEEHFITYKKTNGTHI